MAGSSLFSGFWDFSGGGATIYPMSQWYARHINLQEYLALGGHLFALPLAFLVGYTLPVPHESRRKTALRSALFGFGVMAFMVCVVGCSLFAVLPTQPGYIKSEVDTADFDDNQYRLVRYHEYSELDFNSKLRGGGYRFYLCQCGSSSWRCTCDRIPSSTDSERPVIRAEEIQNAALFINPTSNQLEVHLDDYHYAVESCDAAPSDITSCHAMYFRPLPTPN
ncbi:MAG: hypothetical protein BroJett018_52850 [Chloroflexota bacterium]|nr:MAG: hypothetical protein BroJett018_52850 [Chloroflexota bacterium]